MACMFPINTFAMQLDIQVTFSRKQLSSLSTQNCSPLYEVQETHPHAVKLKYGPQPKRRSPDAPLSRRCQRYRHQAALGTLTTDKVRSPESLGRINHWSHRPRHVQRAQKSIFSSGVSGGQYPSRAHLLGLVQRPA